MTERERLLSAIRETPDDDAPRLVYSDWCEENDDLPRAEFIRVQLALAKLPEGDPARPPLVFRERALMDAHGEAWLSEAPAELDNAELRRGFIETGAMRADDFVRLGEGLFDSVPLRELQLSGDAPRLASCRALARLAKLSAVDARISLLRSVHLRGLRSLDLSSASLAPAALRSLAGGAWPEGLEELDIGHHRWAALVRGMRWPPRLASLRVSSSDLSEESIRPFVSSLSGLELRSLSLSYNRFGDRGIAALLRAKGLAEGLEELDLHSTAMEAAGIRAVASAPLARLRSLKLGLGRIGQEGAEQLAASPHLARLERLGIAFDYTDPGDSGVAALLRSRHLRNVRWLDLSSYGLGPAGARAIAEDARGFWFLDLYSNEIGDEGAQALAASPHLRGLQYLDLYENGIRTAGAAALLRSENARNLTHLNLSGSTMGKAAVEALCDGAISPYATVDAGSARAGPGRRAAERRFGDRLDFEN